MSHSLKVIFEDNHLLVVDKPPVLATMGVDDSTPSLVKLAKQYLREKYRKPGNVYLGVVSRLDSFTSGVIVFARTSKAASRLTRQFQQRESEKYYLCATPRFSKGEIRHGKDFWKFPFPNRWEDWVWHDEGQRRMRCVGVPDGGTPPQGAQQAVLRWRPVFQSRPAQLNVVQLVTGRKHQIRVQFASRDLPILGDRKYNSEIRFPHGIALHAWLLGFRHPVSKQMLRFTGTPPASWDALLASLSTSPDTDADDCRDFLDQLATVWASGESESQP